MPSWLLAAQQAGRGNPQVQKPGPPLLLFPKRFPQPPGTQPWLRAGENKREQGWDPSSQTTSLKSIAARSNGTQHRGAGRIPGLGALRRQGSAAAGCTTSRGPAHPVSPLCWCCAGYVETPTHAVTNGRRTPLTCIALLRPRTATLHPKKLLSVPVCTSTLEERSPGSCPRSCQELQPIAGTARQPGSQAQRHWQSQAAQGCLTL